VAVTDPGVLTELLARVVRLESDLTDCRGILDELGRTGELPSPGRRGRPEPYATEPGAGPLAPPATEPVEPAAPTEPLYGSLLEFVTDAFTPVYCRVPSPTLRWCASWWDHAEAIYRLEALWRSWELYRLEPRLGIASWLRDYLDPQLRELTSPTGPFASCTDERHAPATPLRTAPPPEEYLTDL
jgi:hypothetical protein